MLPGCPTDRRDRSPPSRGTARPLVFLESNAVPRSRCAARTRPTRPPGAPWYVICDNGAPTLPRPAPRGDLHRGEAGLQELRGLAGGGAEVEGVEVGELAQGGLQGIASSNLTDRWDLRNRARVCVVGFEIWQELLGKLGCTVLQAANGRAALDIVLVAATYKRPVTTVLNVPTS